MTTMNISVPDDMRHFVERQMAERGFGTTSEFVRDLIRKEQERQELRALLLQGGAAPRVAEADASYFTGLRARVATGGKVARPAKRQAATKAVTKAAGKTARKRAIR